MKSRSIALFLCLALSIPPLLWAAGEVQPAPTQPAPPQDASAGSIEEARKLLDRTNRVIDQSKWISWIPAIFPWGQEKKAALKQAKALKAELEAIVNSQSPDPEKLAGIQRIQPQLETAVDNLRKFRTPKTGEPGRQGDKDHWKDFISGRLKDNPDDPAMLNLSAQTKLGDGDPVGAAADASKAIAAGGGADSYAMRGAANSQLGDYDAAVSDAQEALNLDPKNEMAFQTMMLSEGRAKASGGAGGSGTRGGGAGTAAAMQGAAAPSATGFKPAFGTVKLTPSSVTQSAEYAKRAQSALAMRDYKSAVNLLTQALELNPQNANAYYLRANAFNQMKLYRQGLEDAQAGLALSPDNVPLLNAKAFAQNRLKDFNGAYGTAQTALQFNPNSADAYANLPYALGGMGDRQGMMDNLAKAAALDPRFRAVIDNLAVQAPTEGDALFLFPGEEGFSSSPKPAPAKKAPRSFGVLAFAAVAGGFLIALGLLRALGAGPWQTMRTKLSRLTGSSPAVSSLEMAAAGAAEAAPASGAPASIMTPPAAAGPKPLGGQYDIVREIGEGGMGLVYEALDRGLHRKVAIKKMRPEIRDDAKERERFLAEAKTVAALKHPGIVDIFSIVEEDGEVYLVFEFVKGRTLFEIVQQAPLSFPAALKCFKEVASALDYAHSRRVIHRDMKPSNVMIDDEGRARVMDFGVARVAKEALTRVAMTQTVFGTPPYMSPEQEQGVVSPQGDVYSMAICLYEALSGRLPFVGTGAGLLMNKMAMSYKPVSEVVAGLPPGIDAVFGKAFVYDLAQRYKTAGELVADLERLKPAA
ncbi:MAG: protein kinase [Elusimicrobiota bacterium]|jgi:tetratricopeptide (TPR) repeat protein/tRNA A-37 threonylcarbamoyl transferase component Bud32